MYFISIFCCLRSEGLFVMSVSGYVIATEMAYGWAPSRHNRKKGCWLFVEVPMYFDLEPINFELYSYFLYLSVLRCKVFCHQSPWLHNSIRVRVSLGTFAT